MKLSNLIFVICTITILMFGLQIHTPLAGASSVTNSDFLEHVQEQEKIHGMIDFSSYPTLSKINGWARDTDLQYFNKNTMHVIILHLNDDISVRDVEFRQYGSSIGTIRDSVVNDALEKLGYDPVPSVSPSPSPTVSPSPSPTVSPSPSPTVSPSPSPTVSPSPSPTVSPSPSPTVSPSPSPTVSPSPSPTVSPSPSPTVSPSPSPTVRPSPSPTVSPSPSPTVSPSPSPTVSPSPSPTVRPSPSPTVSTSPSPTVSTSPSPTVSLSLSPYLEATKRLRIPQNGIVIFSKYEVGKVIQEIHFYQPTPGQYVKVDIYRTLDGYKIIDIEAPEPMKDSPGTIFFQVEKKWLDSRDVDKEKVGLYHVDEGLETRLMKTCTKGDYEQYYAETRGFSIFYIKEKNEPPTDWNFYTFVVAIVGTVFAVVGTVIYIAETRKRGKNGGKNNTKESGGKATEENEKNKEEKSKRKAEEKSSEREKNGGKNNTNESVGEATEENEKNKGEESKGKSEEKSSDTDK